MASKVFVSYKYADSNVAHLYSPLYSPYTYTSTTVRSYVDDFMRRAQSAGCVVYKGERADEDLSYLMARSIPRIPPAHCSRSTPHTAHPPMCGRLPQRRADP